VVIDVFLGAGVRQENMFGNFGRWYEPGDPQGASGGPSSKKVDYIVNANPDPRLEEMMPPGESSHKQLHIQVSWEKVSLSLKIAILRLDWLKKTPLHCTIKQLL
jgi:hypothetical protein